MWNETSDECDIVLLSFVYVGNCLSRPVPPHAARGHGSGGCETRASSLLSCTPLPGKDHIRKSKIQESACSFYNNSFYCINFFNSMFKLPIKGVCLFTRGLNPFVRISSSSSPVLIVSHHEDSH